MAEHHLHIHPFRLFGPSSLLLLQLLNARLIATDGVNLSPKHDSGEDQKEERFKAEEDEEDDRRWWREVTALCPVFFKAEHKMKSHHDECMEGN